MLVISEIWGLIVFGNKKMMLWLRGIAGASAEAGLLPEQFSLWFIADCFMTVDLWIKTKMKLQPKKKYAALKDAYIQQMLAYTEGDCELIIKKAKAMKGKRGVSDA